MTTADRDSKPMCQAAEDFIDEKEEDLKCPFCEIYFEKWGLLKHHLVRHVSEARLGKDLTPVSLNCYYFERLYSTAVAFLNAFNNVSFRDFTIDLSGCGYPFFAVLLTLFSMVNMDFGVKTNCARNLVASFLF